MFRCACLRMFRCACNVLIRASKNLNALHVEAVHICICIYIYIHAEHININIKKISLVSAQKCRGISIRNSSIKQIISSKNLADMSK